MIRRFTKPSSIVAMGVVIALATIGYFQHSAMGEPSSEFGTIEGSVTDALISEKDAAIVYVKESSGAIPAPKDKRMMSQKKITFNPKILAVMVGTTVECPNDDNVTHNIFSPAKSAKPFNFGLYPPGSKKEIVTNKAGVVPFLCNIHAEMGAFCVVCPNQFFAKTDTTGKFKIENVPAGKYKLTFWHEKLRPKTIEVTVTAGETRTVDFSGLEKGKFSIDLLK